MPSPYRINPNNNHKRTRKVKNTDFDNDSHHEADVKRPQSTSNESSKKQKTKNNLKVGSIQENNETNEHYLDNSFKNNDSQMELAMQIISKDKTVRNDTVQNLKEFNQQSPTAQAKKGEQLLSLMPATKKAFNLMGDDTFELSTENDALKNKIGSYDEKWLEESENKMLKQIDDEKRAELIMSRMKKQKGKQWIFLHLYN